MSDKLDPRLVKAAGISGAAGSLATALVMVGVFFGVKGCGGIPGEDTSKHGTGLMAVVLVDDSAPTIPQALILDSPLSRAMKLKGKMAIVGIASDDMKTYGYESILTHAGGAPALIIPDKDGKAVYASKLATDYEAFRKTLTKWIPDLPEPIAPAAEIEPVPVKTVTVQRDAKGREWVETDGHARMLTVKPAPQKFSALPAYAASNPLFPINEWYDLNRRNVFGDEEHCFDQDGISSCVGNGATRTLETVRELAGMKRVKLSPAFLYSLVNGNQDEGASIPDVIPALRKYGTCSFSLLGQKPFYQSEIKKRVPKAFDDALDHTLVDAYRCNTWEEVCSALLTGRYVATFGIQVGNNFQSFDKYGVCGHANGPGNHCVMADGLKKLPDGRWVLDSCNSWGFQWGPWHNGRMYLDQKHLFGGGDQASVCVFRLASRSKSDPYNPPVLKQ